MSSFSITISTVAAPATISVTVLTAYKAFKNQSKRNAEQQEQIEELKTMVKQQQVVITQSPPIDLPPTMTPAPHPTQSGSAQVPPPLPPVQLSIFIRPLPVRDL